MKINNKDPVNMNYMPTPDTINTCLTDAKQMLIQNPLTLLEGLKLTLGAL